MATLLAIGYPDVGTAAQAAERLRRRHEELLVEPDAVAVIVLDSDGEYRVTTSHHPVGERPTWGMLWGLLFGLLFFVPIFGTGVGTGLGGLFGTIERSGVNRAFQQRARDMLRPGSSALFCITTSATAQTVAAALEELGGALLEAPLTSAQEAKLQAALYGSLSPANV